VAQVQPLGQGLGALRVAGEALSSAILTDYHTHPERVPKELVGRPEAHQAHFLESMRAYAVRARELGIGELGFSEHIYRLSLAPGAVPWHAGRTGQGDIGGYVSAVEQVTAECARDGGPVIRLSMEVDIVPSTVSILQAALPLYPFDYLLGSVHEIPDLTSGAGAEDAYRAYYGAIRWACESRLFHSIAHPDRIHRKLDPVPPETLLPLMEETAQILAAAGVCVELSANGVRRGIVGIDPNREFVRICFEREVGITLGSDAHKLGDLGVGIAELRDLAWEAGYRAVATFERGRRIDRPLAPPAANAARASDAPAPPTRS
jgi:histidinol-phosphatase (PHP family)